MPSDEVIKKAVAAMKCSADYEYFFDRLTAASWIEPLRRAGFFRQAPPPEFKGDMVSFPFWPESRYLARVAAQAPELVSSIILDVDTDNIRVHEDFADAALAMSATMAASLVPTIKKWTDLPYQMLLPRKLASLVVHLSRGGEPQAALGLTRSLLAVRVPTSQASQGEDNLALTSQPKPGMAIDVWEYGEVVRLCVPDLARGAKKEAVHMLAGLLEEAIRVPEHVAPPWRDNSFVWRPAIEENERNRYSHGVENHLVTAVRDAAEALVSDDTNVIGDLVRELEARRWPVFQRIGLHLLRRWPEAALELVAERLTDPTLYEDPHTRWEYASLLREQFHRLDGPHQQPILDWIETGPARELAAAMIEAVRGEAPTEAEIRRYVRRWQWERLSVLSDHLRGPWQQRYRELVAQFGPRKGLEPAFKVSVSWEGSSAPVTADQLAAMDVEETIDYLKAWQPSRGFAEPSREGLGLELSKVVSEDPERFARGALTLLGLRPVYVRSVLSGLRDAFKAGKSFEWQPVVELCRWMAGQQRGTPRLGADDEEHEQFWGWTRDAAAELLSEGLVSKPSGIPFELRSAVWNTLAQLVEDTEPTPEHEAESGGSNMDPSTLSLNTTRGKAMHAIVRYAAWARRHLSEIDHQIDHAAMGDAKDAGQIPPEVREVLEVHVNPNYDPSLAVRSVYGWWLPTLYWLDSAWTAEHVAVIFPSEDEERPLWDAAWESYLAFCRPNSALFKLLQDEYTRAVRRIGTAPKGVRHIVEPDEGLGHHLVDLYMHGHLQLDAQDGLLREFCARASDTVRAQVLGSVGHGLCSSEEKVGKVGPAVIERLRLLWEFRLETAKNARDKGSYAAELREFGWWFASAKFDDTWAMRQLLDVLNIAKAVKPDHLVVERLVSLALSAPTEAVECLRLMAEGDREGWSIYGWRDQAKTILRAVLSSEVEEARERARDLVHRLGARGFREYRDLLAPKP